jgi:hypothetical protein
MKYFLLLLLLVPGLLPAQDHNEANYDELKVPPYTLPDPLTTDGGKQVLNAKEWEQIRRPELLRKFEENVYGKMPGKFDKIRFLVRKEDASAMNGRATRKEVQIDIQRGNQTVKLDLLLFVPNAAKKKVPVFLLINNRGKENTDPTRKTKSPFWPAEAVIDSGFAIAAFHVSDMAPDDKDKYMNGVLKLYPELLAAEDGMKAVGAWAWGASRVMDYFLTDRDIDASKVSIVGHSRGGKASLWAAAEDQRFAICFTNCSGNTGAALARRQFGERIGRINSSFPHWFADNYKKYNGIEQTLPVDQHMLIALIAPRPVYATNASKDLWADPIGTFLSLKNAEPVYALYGKNSALPKDPPGINIPVINSTIGYHNREGEHDLTVYDWTHFLQFAKLQFSRSSN